MALNAEKAVTIIKNTKILAELNNKIMKLDYFKIITKERNNNKKF